MKTDFIKSARSLCRLFGGTFKAFVAIAALAFTGAAWGDIEYKEIGLFCKIGHGHSGVWHGVAA